MKLVRLAERIYNTPLLIDPRKAEVIERVFHAHVLGIVDLDLEAEAKRDADAVAMVHAELYAQSGVSFQRADGGYLLGDNGVAVVQVFGTLVQRGDSIDAASGLLGYNRIGARLAAAMDDPEVDAILLEIDSPGGEANGCFDLAAKIREMSATKPIWAHANEQAFSAAYALASAARNLYTPETGEVGSVGVIAMHIDQSKRDASQGYVYTPIFAGKKKNDFSSHAPLSDRAREDAQAGVDRFYDIFVAAVAEGRGIKPAAVRATEAGVLNPDEAKAIRFIDGVASFSETLARLGDVVAKSRASPYVFGTAAAASAPNTQGAYIMDPKQGTTPPAAAEQPTAPTNEALSRARAEGLEEGRRESERLVNEARTAERTRIAAILASEHAIGRFALASHLALRSTMSADEAATVLQAAEKKPDSPQNVFATLMSQTPNPNVDPHAAGNGGEGETAEKEQYGARIAAEYNARQDAARKAKAQTL